MRKRLTFRSLSGTAKTALLSVLLLLLAFCGPVGAAAVATVQLNGMDNIDALSSRSTLTVTISLDAGDETGEDSEWWIVAETSWGWYSYVYPDLWEYSGEGVENLTPAYQGPLFDLTEPFEVLNITGLPTGEYAFYLAVDTLVNGVVDLEALVYDRAAVQIFESETFPVVDTGQTICYNNLSPIDCPIPGESFYGQDAEFTGNAARYTDNQDDTITDDVTGLMWTKSPDYSGDGIIDADDKMTYDEAVIKAGELTIGSYSDWRLPTIKELYSLIGFYGVDPSAYEGTDTSILTPFIDTDYFDFAYGDQAAGERIIDAQFLSSTLYVGTVFGGTTAVFGVNFADGRIKGYPAANDFYVFYVRDEGGYGRNSLTDNGDGTITDGATGLMWSRDDSGTGLNWEEALDWVETQNAENHLGYSDWRMPDAKELQGIVDYSRAPDATDPANQGPAIDPLFNITSIIDEAGDTDYPYFWTGTTHVGWGDVSGQYAAYIAFGRALGYMNDTWMDVHGAGAQRADPKEGDPADYPEGHGPQGDAVRIYNYVRLVRDAN